MNITRSTIVDLVLFAATLVCAWVFQWKANDLIWSLWVSSLTIGYITLIFGSLIRGIQNFPWKTFFKDISSPEFRNDFRKQIREPSSLKKLVIIIAIAFIVVVFLVTFFTVHFGMFHFIHGIFLNSFFPLEGITYPKSGFDLPKFAIQMAARHWEFVLASAISQFFRLDSKSDEPVKGSDFAFGPYKAVLRMHLMIFVFAFLNTIHADNFFVYAIILLVYFMPWAAFKKKRSETPATV